MRLARIAGIDFKANKAFLLLCVAYRLGIRPEVILITTVVLAHEIAHTVVALALGLGYLKWNCYLWRPSSSGISPDWSPRRDLCSPDRTLVKLDYGRCFYYLIIIRAHASCQYNRFGSFQSPAGAATGWGQDI